MVIHISHPLWSHSIPIKDSDGTITVSYRGKVEFIAFSCVPSDSLPGPNGLSKSNGHIDDHG